MAIMPDASIAFTGAQPGLIDETVAPSISKLSQILSTVQSLAATAGSTIVALNKPLTLTTSTTAPIDSKSAAPLKTPVGTFSSTWFLILIASVLGALLFAPMVLRKIR